MITNIKLHWLSGDIEAARREYIDQEVWLRIEIASLIHCIETCPHYIPFRSALIRRWSRKHAQLVEAQRTLWPRFKARIDTLEREYDQLSTRAKHQALLRGVA
jgi:hypothetical protein